MRLRALRNHFCMLLAVVQRPCVPSGDLTSATSVEVRGGSGERCEYWGEEGLAWGAVGKVVKGLGEMRRQGSHDDMSE